MRNVTRDFNGWRVQLNHKNLYYAERFPDAKHNHCWAQSAIAARLWLLQLQQKLGIVDQASLISRGQHKTKKKR